MSPSPPRVSIVIPAHNAADTLDTTLQSVVAQTMPDWEAVVIDDGSTDATADVVQGWMEKDHRFRLIRQRQGGVCRARNAGLEAGEAEWALFLDADDWIAPEHLERMFAALDGAPGADAAYCGYRRVTSTGELLPINLEPEVEHRAFEVFARYCAFAIHCVILRRGLVLAVGGFDPELPVCEDWDLWQRVARSGARFVAVAEVLAFYRMRGESLSCDMGAIAQNGLKVISRARRPDPRVPEPDPRFVEGLGEEGIDANRTYFLLWCVVVAAAAGQDIEDRLGPIGALIDVKDELPSVHSVIRHALLIGAQLGEDRIDEAWRRAFRALGPFLDNLEAASTQPGLARRISYAFELSLLRASRLEQPMTFATALGMIIDVGRFVPVTPPSGVDTLHLRFHAGDELLAKCELPVWGALSAEDVAAVAIDTLGFETIRQRGGYDEAALIEAAGWNRPRPETGSHAREAAIIAEIWAETFAKTRSTPPAEATDAPEARYDGDARSRAFWEEMFETPDPWSYDSGYERLKYEQTLSMLGDEPVARALELACAEGHFTARLADRVERLVASDISRRALDRAALRCAERDNVEYRRIDLADDLPTGFDLTICSEALYYLSDEKALAELAAKLRDTLVPGGRLVHAHAMAIADDPTSTGYEWGHPYGGETIARALSETEGLALERTIKTELYRIDLFRRVEAETEPPTMIEQAPFAMPDPSVQRSILWGGAIALRSERMAAETTRDVPVLMYHRIADDGPEALAPYRTSPADFEAQLWFLRRHGYYGITSPQIEWYRAQDRPIEGRPVMISFDDAYRDFREAALPILYRYDFRAEMFVVSDKVGGVADWDAEYGPPAPLMGWQEIADAQARGILFGSHLASHRMAESLTSEELLTEAARSRATLQARLGDECISIAAPYGNSDERYVRILHEAGYRMGFTTRRGIASFSDHALALPRIEIRGDWTLADFAAALGLPIPTTEARPR